VLLGISAIVLSPPASGAPIKYRTCSAVNADYPAGVATNRFAADAGVRSGFLRPTTNKRLYNSIVMAARGLDRPVNGIACEVRVRATPPALVPQVPANTAPVPAGQVKVADYLADRQKYANKTVVLFFNATWCSECEKTRRDLAANKGKFPAGLTIVDIDYDTNVDLRRQYGVTVQHTFVKVNAAGDEVKKWTGTVSLQEIAKKADVPT